MSFRQEDFLETILQEFENWTIFINYYELWRLEMLNGVISISSAGQSTFNNLFQYLLSSGILYALIS